MKVLNELSFQLSKYTISLLLKFSVHMTVTELAK